MRRLGTLARGVMAGVALVVLIELVLQGTALWAQWAYQREVTLLQPERLRILCLGDSNTYGLYLPTGESWPSQVQGLLDQKAPGRYQVINLGFPGTPTVRIAENLPGFLERFQPDRLVLLAGVNDLIYGAIDADNPAPTALERVTAFATTNLRLYRAWLLWKRGREARPDVVNDMDGLSRGLLSLAGMDDAAALRTLAGLYRDRGFVVREDGDAFWLQYGERAVHLNGVLSRFRGGDLFALTNAYIGVPIEAGMDMRDWDLHAQIHVDGTQFEMRPVRGSSGADEQVLERNVAHVAATARRAGVPLLLLTYASRQHYYGVANQVVRAAASRHDIPLLDVEPAISAQCPDTACSALFFPDYHPTAAGYRQMAALVAARLDASAPPR